MGRGWIATKERKEHERSVLSTAKLRIQNRQWQMAKVQGLRLGPQMLAAKRHKRHKAANTNFQVVRLSD